jgi:hypothetical protein
LVPLLSIAFHPGYINFVIKIGNNCPIQPPYKPAAKIWR